jgi:hypothetical protein
MTYRSRKRLCDCGCGRPAWIVIASLDLGFSEKCLDAYMEALRQLSSPSEPDRET